MQRVIAAQSNPAARYPIRGDSSKIFLRSISLPLFGIAALALSTILFTTGCGNDARARVRVVHASPDAPNVDVLLDNKAVLTNVAYKAASAYLTIGAGQHTAKRLTSLAPKPRSSRSRAFSLASRIRRF